MSTYSAHIITSSAPELGEPAVIIMADTGDEIGAANKIAYYPLDGALPTAVDILDEHGWQITSTFDTVAHGYLTATVKAPGLAAMPGHSSESDVLWQDAAPDTPPCSWFAKCSHAATHYRQHPILGDVPICNRCANKIEKIEGE
jgi:hypothetical protein